jgi:AraC-like DNA-binding protein
MDLMWYDDPLMDDALMVAGPDQAAWVSTMPPDTGYTGLRFAPGTAPAVLGVPAHELRDSRVPLADLWPARQVRRLTGYVRAAADRGAALEEIAAGRFQHADPVIGEIVARLSAGSPVSATADAVGLSARQLHRRSLASFGYGPKTLERILRMNRALDLARAGTPFATVAAKTGYADQAHLAREVKTLAGVPLSELVSS